MKLKKAGALGLSCVIALGSMAGCGSSKEKEKTDGKEEISGEIRYAFWDTTQQPYFEKCIEKFNEQYPDVKVSSTVNPLLYGSICIWKNQISRKKYYFWNIACCTDGSIIFFYPATVSDDTENGIVKHNTGVIYTRIVQCFWNISDETVFYGTSERTGRCGKN